MTKPTRDSGVRLADLPLLTSRRACILADCSRSTLQRSGPKPVGKRGRTFVYATADILAWLTNGNVDGVQMPQPSPPCYSERLLAETTAEGDATPGREVYRSLRQKRLAAASPTPDWLKRLRQIELDARAKGEVAEKRHGERFTLELARGRNTLKEQEIEVDSNAWIAEDAED